MKRRLLWGIAYVASLAVFITGVVVLVRDRTADARDPVDPVAAEELPALAPMPFPATIDSPMTTDAVPVGTSVSVTVGGYSGAGVAKVDLYDGARLVDTVVPPAGSPTAVVTFPALTTGSHQLSAQVTDGDGQVSLSPVLPVPVSPSPLEGDMPVPVAPQDGETPADVAERVGVDPDQIVATAPDAVAPAPDQLRPTIALDAVIGPGSTVVAVVRPDQPAPAVDPNALAGDGGLRAELDDCGVELSSGEAFEGTVRGWVSVGTGADATTLKGLAPGPHSFVLLGADRVPSPPTVVDVPAECAEATGWTGTASIVDGVLHLPPAAGGSRVWLYLTVGGVSLRAPASQDVGFGAGTATPVGHVLPPLAGRRLHLEVWRATGDVGGTKVAEGRLDVGAGHDITEVIGDSTLLSLTGRLDESKPFDRMIEMGSKDASVNFRWEAASPRVTKVMWQVLVADPKGAASDPAPFGLLAAGISETSGPANELGGQSGEFSFDTADIAGRDATGADAAFAGLIRPLTSVTVPVTFGMLTTPKPAGGSSDRPTIADVGAGSFAVSSKPATLTELDPSIRAVQLPTYGDDVFVRVIHSTATMPSCPDRRRRR